MKKMLVVVAMSAVSVFAGAAEIDARNAATRTIDLQDGSIVYVFKSGKMALQSPEGRAISTKAGTVLKAKDGSDVTMVGNDVARLDELLKKGLNEPATNDASATDMK